MHGIRTFMIRSENGNARHQGTPRASGTILALVELRSSPRFVPTTSTVSYQRPANVRLELYLDIRYFLGCLILHLQVLPPSFLFKHNESANLRYGPSGGSQRQGTLPSPVMLIACSSSIHILDDDPLLHVLSHCLAVSADSFRRRSG